MKTTTTGIGRIRTTVKGMGTMMIMGIMSRNSAPQMALESRW
jgi:hypothetical protein